MGLLDFLRRAKPNRSEESFSDMSEQKPDLPQKATIAEFNPSTAEGRLNCANGSTLHFSQTSCSEFEPTLGFEVIVEKIEAHPLVGFSAIKIQPDPNSLSNPSIEDTQIHSEIEAKDIQHIVGRAQSLGWITILLNEAPPVEKDAFIEWAERFEFDDYGIRVSANKSIQIGFGSHAANVFIGNQPYPLADFEAMGGPTHAPRGQGFISLSLGLPGMVRTTQIITGAQQPDPWASDGALRNLTRIASALLEEGCGVLLPVAGCYKSKEQFLALLDDLDDPQVKPFGAWLSWAVDPEAGWCRLFGLSLHGMRDVAIEVDPNDDWMCTRAQEALLLAAYSMVRENRDLEDSDILDVPVGILHQIGPNPLTPFDGDTESYEVEIPQDLDDITFLKRINDKDDIRARLRSYLEESTGRGKIRLSTYQEYYRHQLSATHHVDYITELVPELPSHAPQFVVEVLAARDLENTYLITTNGLGFKCQVGGKSDDSNDRLELVLATPNHSPKIASILATIGEQIHAHRGEAIFKIGDTIDFPNEELHSVGYILGYAGTIELKPSVAIHLLEVMPIWEEDYQEINEIGGQAWLEQQGAFDLKERASVLIENN